MTGSLFLAWKYITYHRLKSAIMVIGLSMALFLPLAVNWMMGSFESSWRARAADTPLIIGAKGSEFDLVLQSLYFTGGELERVTYGEVLRVDESGYALGIPLHLGYTSRGFPIVGTTLDYFDQRELRISEGTLPLMLGDVVLGYRVSQDLDLGAGDTIISDPENVFNIAGSYPLQMNIVGVLEETGTPDDEALFVDVKTSWVVEGIGHGHEDLQDGTVEDEGVVMKREDGNVVANSALIEYTRITPDNIASFHFHMAEDELPLSAVLAFPPSEKDSALLRGRYVSSNETVQAVVPSAVINEMLSIILKVRRLFDANVVVVAITTFLFIWLIIILSIRIRRNEMETMVHLGCRKGTIFSLFLFEYVILLLIAFCLASLLAWAALLSLDSIIQFLMKQG